MASLETWIGLRYLRAKKRSGFMSFISVMSIVGIALGVIALIVVLSVVNGFQKEIRGQLLNIAPHAEVGYLIDSQNGTPATWQALQQKFSGKPEVLASAPFIAGQGLLANSGEVRGTQLRGILPDQERKVIDYADKMTAGSFDALKADEFGIILGESLAETLGAKVNEKVTVITPEGNVTPAGVVPRLKQFTVVGIVKTGFDEADSSLALIHLADAQKLYRTDDAAIALRLRLADPQNAPAVMERLLPAEQRKDLWTQNWTDNNRSYFSAGEMEKRMLRHRYFAHAGAVAARHYEDFRGAGHGGRRVGHDNRRGVRPAAGVENRRDYPLDRNPVQYPVRFGQSLFYQLPAQRYPTIRCARHYRYFAAAVVYRHAVSKLERGAHTTRGGIAL